MKKLFVILVISFLMIGFTIAQEYRIVNLHWNSNPEGNIAGYNMYRGFESGGPYWQINQVLIPHTGAGTENYQDVYAEVGNTYYYVCRAINTLDVQSERSNEAWIFIEPMADPEIPSAPTGLTVVIE